MACRWLHRSQSGRWSSPLTALTRSIISSILSIVLVGWERFLAGRVVYALRARGRLQVPALIIGAGGEGRMVAEPPRSPG
jgi:FlaA1/EpsC-like NDP-sugar epimerase